MRCQFSIPRHLNADELASLPVRHFTDESKPELWVSKLQLFLRIFFPTLFQLMNKKINDGDVVNYTYRVYNLVKSTLDKRMASSFHPFAPGLCEYASERKFRRSYRDLGCIGIPSEAWKSPRRSRRIGLGATKLCNTRGIEIIPEASRSPRRRPSYSKAREIVLGILIL